MSYIFGLNAGEQRQQLQSLTADWDGQNEVGPGFLDGVGAGLAQGVMRGGARVAQAATLAGAVVPIAADALTGDTSAQDWYFENVVDDIGTRAVDHWTPAAGEVGTVGQVLGGLGEIALPLMLGGGNPAILAGSTQLTTGAELVGEGVDADTAGAVGLVAGGATALGAWLPFFGKTLAQRVGMNAAANVALGAAERGAEGSILAGAGYDELAARYDPFDLQAAAVDALTGAAFGAIYRGDAPDLPSAIFGERGAQAIQGAADDVMASLAAGMKPSDIDAAFAARNIKQFQVHSAPGRPVDADSWAAHSRGHERAMEQLLTGREVDVGDVMAGSSFERPAGSMRGVLDDWLAEADDLDAPGNASADFVRPAAATVDDLSLAPPQAAVDADPDVAALRQHIDQQGDFEVRIAAAADDGEAGVTMKASELMAQADEMAAEAEAMGQGIMAAARCFLGAGT